MNAQTTILKAVEDELRRNEIARSDDRELVYAILSRYGFSYPKEDFFRLPNIGYITRAKRLVQKEAVSLRWIRKRRPNRRNISTKTLRWTDRLALLFR